MLACELPFKRLGSSCPVVLKVQKAFGDGVEIRKVIGRQDLPLDDREIDFDLVEPTCMNRRMHERQAGVKIPQTLGGAGPTVCRAIVHDPEDAPGIVIRRSCHDLLHEPVKGRDAILGFAAAKDSGPVDVQCRDVGPGATTEVLMLDMHGRARTATLRRVFAAASLNAGLFIRGDDEFVIL